MKEFIDKLIERLEEIKTYYAEDFSQGYSCEVGCVERYEVEKIINELTEEYKPKTQADKIRSMSDEELADYIIFIGANIEEKIPYCKSTTQCTEILDSGRIVPDKMCRECLVKWLQSEA